MSARRMRTDAPAGPARVELHIEELVLHGFAPGDHRRIGEAVQRELTRMLGERGAPRQEARAPRGGSAEATARQVAQAVYGQVAGALAPPSVRGKRQ